MAVRGVVLTSSAAAVVLAAGACEGCCYFPGPDAGPSDGGVVPGAMVINELMSSNQSTVIDGALGFPDWIELKNRGDAPIALDGWRLADGSSAGPFPAGLTIGAGGYLVVLAIDATDPGTAALPTFPFKLSATLGDSVRLIDSEGVVTDLVTFGALGANQSFGRLPDGEGEPAALPFPSPGRANDDDGGEGEGEGEGECVPPFAAAPPIYLNEVETQNSATLVDNEYESWIELHNASDAPVAIEGLVLADNASLAGAFALPSLTIAQRGFLVVVADEDGPTQGDWPHTTQGLLLSQFDDRVVLGDRCGTTWRTLALDPTTPPDTAFGLLPDGDDTAGGRPLTAPTPAAPNQ